MKTTITLGLTACPLLGWAAAVSADVLELRWLPEVGRDDRITCDHIWFKLDSLF